MASLNLQEASPSSNKLFVKELVETTTHTITSIPSYYAQCNKTTNDFTILSESTSIPVIDFSLLMSSTTDDQKRVIEELGKACQDWGFFMLVNHGIPESLTETMIQVSKEFFDLPEEEKRQYVSKHVLDPITSGTSYNNALNDQVFFWRDFLKVFVHPELHFPSKPESFRDLVSVYSESIREVALKLMSGISESLGLEQDYLMKELDLEKGLQIFAANYYPRCPRPESAIGLPPHTDHGLLTLLVQNGVGGLEIQHQGGWIHVNPLPNSILVNTGDHLEIISNGKYKSVTHRAVLNDSKTRISLAMPHGPALDAIVRPALPLLEREGSVAAYSPVEYRDYLEKMQLTKFGAKSMLEQSKILQE